MPNLPKNNQKYSNGQSLIEVLITIAIFLLLSQAVFTTSRASFYLISSNRARVTAKHLAQEKIELVRNLAYDDVGTSGGIPSGPLSQTETVRRNNLTYTINSDIIYIDDPFDDQAPLDLLPTDYKRVRIEVTWEGIAKSRGDPFVLVTDVSPKGVETTLGGGTLSIFVIDANNDPVAQANVAINAPSLSPAISLNLNTAANGRIILPGAPPCDSCYEITVTKSGYTTDRTYSTTEIANPTSPHQGVLEGKLSEISFKIDHVSTLNISSVNSRENEFAPLGNVAFRLKGSIKTIGTDALGEVVYKYDENLSTDSSGNVSIPNFERDDYTIELAPTSSYDISGSQPYIPISVSAGTTQNYSFSLDNHSTKSLLLLFADSGNNPLASVSATLSDGESYEETKYSGDTSNPDFGHAFFSNLTEDSYNLTATASGYLDNNQTIPVSAGWNFEKIIMNQ